MAKIAIGRLSNVPFRKFFSRGKGVAKIFDSKTVNVLGHVALNRGPVFRGYRKRVVKDEGKNGTLRYKMVLKALFMF